MCRPLVYPAFPCLSSFGPVWRGGDGQADAGGLNLMMLRHSRSQAFIQGQLRQKLFNLRREAIEQLRARPPLHDQAR